MGRCPKCNRIGVIHEPDGICTYCCIAQADRKIAKAGGWRAKRYATRHLK